MAAKKIQTMMRTKTEKIPLTPVQSLALAQLRMMSLDEVTDILMTKASIEGVKVKITFTYPRKKKADGG